MKPSGEAARSDVADGAAPAGWYPDPAGSGSPRWWDGWAWGDVFSWSVYLPPRPRSRLALIWEQFTAGPAVWDGAAGRLLSLAAAACSLFGGTLAALFFGVSLATGGPVHGAAPAVLTALTVLFPVCALAVLLLRSRNRTRPGPPRGRPGSRRSPRMRALAARLRLFGGLPPCSCSATAS